jgi:hypothetical protein
VPLDPALKSGFCGARSDQKLLNFKEEVKEEWRHDADRKGRFEGLRAENKDREGLNSSIAFASTSTLTASGTFGFGGL